jgi:hypothetical protein
LRSCRRRRGRCPRRHCGREVRGCATTPACQEAIARGCSGGCCRCYFTPDLSGADRRRQRQAAAAIDEDAMLVSSEQRGGFDVGGMLPRSAELPFVPGDRGEAKPRGGEFLGIGKLGSVSLCTPRRPHRRTTCTRCPWYTRPRASTARPLEIVCGLSRRRPSQTGRCRGRAVGALLRPAQRQRVRHLRSGRAPRPALRGVLRDPA